MTVVPVQDGFADVFGNRRGSDAAYFLAGSDGAKIAAELISLVEAGLIDQPLKALADCESVTNLVDNSKGYFWPPKDFKERKTGWQWERMAMVASVHKPSDEEFELEYDASACVRRALTEHLIQEAQEAWFTTFRDFSHVIGYRRHDIADHAIVIDGVMHLFKPANVLLVGDLGFPQNLPCGKNAHESVSGEKTQYLRRGEYAEQCLLGKAVRKYEPCQKCRFSSESSCEETVFELPDTWTPIPNHLWFGDVSTYAKAQIYEQLQLASFSEREAKDLAVKFVRAQYLACLPSLMQTSDKPCLWYRAPGLSKEQAQEINFETYDNRIACVELLDKMCSQKPVIMNETELKSKEKAWASNLRSLIRNR